LIYDLSRKPKKKGEKFFNWSRKFPQKFNGTLY